MPDERKRLLIAEDEKDMRDLLKRTLTHEGFNVETVKNGKEAIELLDKGKAYDALITDLRMPGLDGEELVPLVKKRAPAMKIILMSGYADTAQYLKLVQLGAYDYVTKPFKIPDILEVLDRALGLEE